MRCCRCTGAPDIGRAHPGGRRGTRSFTPGRRPLDCTTAAPHPVASPLPRERGLARFEPLGANDRIYARDDVRHVMAYLNARALL